MEEQLKDLAVKLFEINALKFGDFVTKAGLKTPVYFDLRVIVSHPKIMQSTSSLVWSFSKGSKDVSQICGVPYTALPLATLVSVESNIPMLIRRKETKSYGTKKLIEGQFKQGEKCVIIEDVVTTGSSVLETVKDLRKEGLNVDEAYVIVDREQGGKKNLEENGITMRSLYTLTQLMKYLEEAGKVTPEIVESVAEYLKTSQASLKSGVQEKPEDRLKLDFATRANLATNPVAKKLFEIMSSKETTLCLAADLTCSDSIIKLAALAGPHIAVLKIHIDIVEKFSSDFIKQLKDLSKRHNFLIMEDRKFGDIGHTVSLQYGKGIYKIAEWADLVTAHTVPGSGVISGLQDGLNGISENRGVFLVTEMSSAGTLTTGEYLKQSTLLAESSNLVAGLVCQSNVFSNPGLIQLTPGVKLTKTTDGLGQQYNTPESVVKAGADLAVVGRGITEAKDKLAATIEYKEQLWAAYKDRIN